MFLEEKLCNSSQEGANMLIRQEVEAVLACGTPEEKPAKIASPSFRC